MRIGLDFDNTLVCYDQLFWELARERAALPAAVARRKEAVRDALRAQGREALWTQLQGEVYGAQIERAEAFPGVIDALRAFRERGWSVAVISHKTRVPFAGPAYDLHAAGTNWLRQAGLLDPAVTGLDAANVFWETTAAAKHQRIAAWGCDWFVDDLPEFLLAPEFPAGVRRAWFDPHRSAAAAEKQTLFPFHHWNEAVPLLEGRG